MVIRFTAIETDLVKRLRAGVAYSSRAYSRRSGILNSLARLLKRV